MHKKPQKKLKLKCEYDQKHQKHFSWIVFIISCIKYLNDIFLYIQKMYLFKLLKLTTLHAFLELIN